MEIYAESPCQQGMTPASGDFSEDAVKIKGSRAYERSAGRARVVQPVAICPPVLGNHGIPALGACSRQTHLDEVARIAKYAARRLGLNESLCEAVAIGHDIGHSPYSHIGDLALSEITGISIKHGEYGAFIARELERLNLTDETLLGIMLHTDGYKTSRTDLPQEYSLCYYADLIDWVISDVPDVKHAGYLKKKDVPKEFYLLGSTRQQKIDSVVTELIKETEREGRVILSEDSTEPIARDFWALKRFLVENVYDRLEAEGGYKEHKDTIWGAYHFFKKNLPELSPLLCTHDLTDVEASYLGRLISVPHDPKAVLERMKEERFGIFYVMHELEGKEYSIPYIL